MNKPAFQRTTSKAAFEWDPNKTQTYALDTDTTLPGTAASFNKVTGANFTMDAPLGSLTLKIAAASKNQTVWGSGSGSVATAIAVNRGTFVYDASDVGAFTELSFGPSSGLETTLTVADDGQFIAVGPPAGEPVDNVKGLYVRALGVLKITAAESGVIDITCLQMDLPAQGLGPEIRIEDQARMSVFSSEAINTLNATVDVSSAPDAGYALRWAAALIDLESTFIAFSGASSGLFRCSVLDLNDTRIATGDSAKCEFQFNSFKSGEPAQFILTPGTATMQFDAFTDGAYPFDFINDDPKKRYPAGMFEFTSKGTRNGGQFKVRVDSAFQANAIVSNGFVAIDGNIVGIDRIKAPFVNGYAVLTQY
jgi:hypothetical protein